MSPPRSSNAHLRRGLLAAAALLLRTPPAALSLSVAPPLPSRAEHSAPPGTGGDDLLPALSRVRLEFSAWPERDRRPAPGARLVLRRRDGLDLYGRPVVHDAGDARGATLTFLDGGGDGDGGDGLWEATLVLAPDDGSGRGAFRDDRRRGPAASSPGAPPPGCFVAMNRFAVRDDCRAPFEERWSNRNTRLPSQPGFLGFSLLRRAAPAARAGPARFDETFNYSTCTIWDSIGSWRAWREGVGRTSHAASHGEEGKKRVPVSEWLRAPSSPIFWEG